MDAYLHPVLDFSRSTLKAADGGLPSWGYSGEKSELRQTAVFAVCFLLGWRYVVRASGFIVKIGKDETKMRKQGVFAVITAAVMSVGAFFMTGVSVKAEDGATALSEMQAEEAAETGEKTDGDWRYRVLEDGTAVITGYDGEETEIEIPDSVGGVSVTSLGYNIFDGLESYESVTVPKSVTNIEEYSFGFSILMGGGVIATMTNLRVYGYAGSAAETYANDNGFKFCDIEHEWSYGIWDSDEGTIYILGYNGKKTEIEIPDTIDGKKVVGVGPFAFQSDNSLKSVKLPDSATYVGPGAFNDCKSLETVIGNGEIEISDDAFWGCSSLSNVIMPNISGIGYMAFSDCTSLKSITISKRWIGEAAFAGCTSLENVVISSDIKGIGRYPFLGCESLKSIVIPETVESISEWAFGYSGEWDVNTESYVPYPDFTIYGYPDTAAETYAKENGFTFIEMKDEPIETPSNTEITVNASGELSPKLETAKEELFSAIFKYFTEEELSAVRAGTSALEIKLSVASLDDSVSESDKELIAKVVNDISDGTKLGFKVMNYLDIKLHASIDGRELSIAETDGLLTVSVELENPVNGTYKVIRIHDGKAESIDAQLSKDGKRLSFATDKFSTYAIVYSDVASGDITRMVPVVIFVLNALAAATLLTVNKFKMVA